MRVFFTVCAVFGAAGLLGLLVMLIFFRLKVNIGFKLPKCKTVPLEQFVPQSIYGYAAFTLSFGLIGLALLPLNLPWYMTVPVDICFSMIVNFIGAHFLAPLFIDFFSGREPNADELSGLKAVASERIEGDGYGRVRVKYGDRSFYYDAVSVYHTDIEKNETVDVVLCENKLLFVQKENEIYKIYDERA